MKNASLDRYGASGGDNVQTSANSVIATNDRYVRKHLKPIAKSVYQNNGVVRLNGSLNGVIGAPSLNMNTSAKVLQSNKMQLALT